MPTSRLPMRAEQKESAMEPTDKRVAEKLAAFENGQEPVLLQEALETIETAEQNAPAGDKSTRTQQLLRWLLFFATLDRHIDSKWGPNDVPITGVIPPPSDGKAYFSGVDPSAIADPAARAQYEQTLKASKEYAERYRVQHELRRLDERAMRAAEKLITRKYADSPTNRQELIDVLTTAPVSELRKEQLRAFMSTD